MNSFLDKHRVEGIPAAVKASRTAKGPDEVLRDKLLGALKQQSVLISAAAAGEALPADGGRRPRLFWRDVSGQLYFTPRFGNEFLFGLNGGVAAADFPALGELIEDFARAVSAGEFDDQLLRIASTRKGRGKGVPKTAKSDV